MPAGLRVVERWCAVATRRIAFLGVLAMLAISLATALDISLRAAFNAPISGFNEIVEVLMAVAIAACFPAGFAQKVHLNVDFLGARLGDGVRAWLEALGALLLLFLFVFLAWRLGVVAADLAAQGRTTILLGWPVAPFLWTVSGLFGLGALVQLVMVAVGFEAAAGRRTGGASGRTVAIATVGTIVLIAVAVTRLDSIVSWIAPAMPTDAVVLSAVLFAVVWMLILLLVPVAAAMGLIGLVGAAMVLGTEPALVVLGTEALEFLTNINLAVLPLFLMMGSFASVAGLSSDIYGLAHAVVGHRRGGLALATIGGCAGFGALTGSSLATAVTIGRVALPEMRDRGYSAGLATGCVAAGGTLGQLVPPSAAIVVFAILVEESIGRLFIGALIPALVAIALYMITVAVVARLSPDSAPDAGRAERGALWAALRRSSLALLLFGVVIGGIYGGIFTATEAAAVGAGGAFLIALARGRLGGGAFWQVMGETTATTAMIYVLILGAVTFSFFVGAAGMPNALAAFVESLGLSRYGVIVLLLAIYLLLGAIMDPFAMMVITVPIVTPLVTGLGFDIVWWGIVMVSVVETGLITPPFGINVFVLKGVAPDVPLSTVFRGVLPFVTADIVRLAILVAFPALVLWLPSTMVN